MLLGEKGQELPLAQRRWKGRLVGGGDQITDAAGRRVFPKTHHIAPVSLMALRLVIAFAMSRLDGEMLQGDIKNAFPKAPLPGAPTFLSLQKELWPGWWKGAGFREPVLRVRKALYGHPLAGAAWNLLLASWLLAAGWVRIVDTGEESLYARWIALGGEWHLVLLAVYTDDVFLGGSLRAAWVLFLEIHARFGYGPKVLAAPFARSLLGLELLRHPRVGGVRCLFVHQTGYISQICEMYVKERGLPGVEALKYVLTPLKERPDAGDEQKRERPGILAEEAATHVGRFQWVVRCTRPDALQAVIRLGRRTAAARWSVLEDEGVHTVYSYLWAHREVGMWMLVDPSARDKLHLLSFTDADFNGDYTTTQRSTSAGATYLASSAVVKAPLGFLGLTQTSTSRSTPEAEVVSVSDVTYRQAVPIQETIAQCTGAVLPIVLGVDNTTAEHIVRVGSSRKLAYLKRHQRVSLSALNETYASGNASGNVIRHQASERMPVDVITKPMASEGHWRCMHELGLGRFRDGPPLGARAPALLAAVIYEGASTGACLATGAHPAR
jgi:hypothetical protein